jgi:hypothetical protein
MVAQEGFPEELAKPKRVDVSPSALGTDRQPIELQRNDTGTSSNPPRSPTPPGFPFGAPDGIPRGGPPASGPQPETRSIPVPKP